MKQEDMAGWPDYDGIRFDARTGKTYRRDGVETGFTFERPCWTGPFGFRFSGKWLKPLSFATASTAARLLVWAHGLVPPSLAVTVRGRPVRVWLFTRTAERLLLITDMGGRSARFNAGQLASDIIRLGEPAACSQWQAKWRAAGLEF